MIVYKVTIGNVTTEFINRIQAESFAGQNGLLPNVVEEEQRETTVDYEQLVVAAIKLRQDVAPELLRRLYAQNTLAGISTQQSDEMFDEYADVILRIREGAFPTAYYRLQQKQPDGFVTQELLNVWLAEIAKFL